MPKISSRSKIHQHEAYTHRDVVSLPPSVNKWSASLEKIQKEHNRILQPGFMHRDVNEILEDCKKAGVVWLTDVCCPSVKADLMLHISKEMVVNYQVSDVELNTQAHTVYASLVGKDEASFIKSINEDTDMHFKNNIPQDNLLEENARKMLIKNFKDTGLKSEDITKEQLHAAKNLMLDIERRKIMDTIVPKIIKEHLDNHALSLGLKKKTCYQIGHNHDFFYGGAAGSGKSTLTKQDFSDDDQSKINKKDCIVVATDIYRAFTLPGTEAHEQKQTKDIFTRTQDSAYMVKERVLEELKGMKKERPNLINDGVTVEWDVREILKQTPPKNIVSKVALYRGDEAGYRGIAERALKRAQDLNAEPADKGRYIETTSLLKGHSEASRLFLANLPANAVTEVFDTNVDRNLNEQPVKVAIVNSPQHTVEILNLKIMSEWLNKKNLNVEAEHPVELILNKKLRMGVTDPHNKATSILDLVKGNPFEKPPVPFKVILKNANGETYASLVSNDMNEVKLEVINLEIFKEQVDKDNSPEAQVLRTITRLTNAQTAAKKGSLEAQASEFVDKIDKRIDSAYEEAVKKRNEDAYNAMRKRAENDLNLEELTDSITTMEARIDLHKEEGAGLDALETALVENIEIEQESKEKMIKLAHSEEMKIVLTQQDIKGIRDLYLQAPQNLKVKLNEIFKLKSKQDSDFRFYPEQSIVDLKLAYKAVRQLFLDYHPDRQLDGKIKPGYHELNEIKEHLDKLIKLQVKEQKTTTPVIEGNLKL